MGFLGGGRRALVAAPLLFTGAIGYAGCYDTGDGSDPPLEQFYYPVGLTVSHGGSVLYVVNSDFDLQYNGGTLQSYDLSLIRRHTLDVIADPTSANVPFVRKTPPGQHSCPDNPPIFKDEGGRQPLGETCAPPVRSNFYVRDTAVIGAFATDMLLSPPPERLIPQVPKGPTEGAACDPNPISPQQCEPGLVCDCGSGLTCSVAAGATAATCGFRVGSSRFSRLYAPVRGNATLTWASVERDQADTVLPEDPAQRTKATYAPFRIQCGQDGVGRCDNLHQVGEDPLEPDNTRGITMPGEPFGMAFSEDGESIVITHQNETKSSLFSTGLSRSRDAVGPTLDGMPPPAIQFVADEVPIGGVGIAAVPHDRDAFLGESAFPRPSFLETSRSVAQVSLLRRYADEFGGTRADRLRPFLDVEAGFPVTASAGGTDSRGIVIDPTPRLACKARVAPADPANGRVQADVERDLRTCARKPARVFIANRTPAALLVGSVGFTEGTDGAYDPDRLTIHTSVPLSAGASRVYLAPVVEADGGYGLRVFAICFDSATVFVYDPENNVLENVIKVGPGPFAMAFDPFNLEDVAVHAQVPFDPREPSRGLRRYRFGYVASFTQSFVQLIDLDNAQPSKATYERVVFTLGEPTNPKGS